MPAHQELALQEPNDEDNPIVQESEPELEALADVTEPDSVTEDSAEFAPLEPDDDEMPAGPGDAPVAAVGEEVSDLAGGGPRGRRSGRRHSDRDDR